MASRVLNNWILHSLLGSEFWTREPQGRKTIWDAKVWEESDGWHAQVTRGAGAFSAPDGQWEFSPFSDRESAMLYTEEYLAWRRNPETWKKGIPPPVPILATPAI
jgi:hypothetical protein